MTTSDGDRLGNPDLRYPVAALDLDTVRHNVDEMDRYCRQWSVHIAPHAKTTMVEQILALPAERASTWGLTVANAEQGQLAQQVGAQRILVANQLVERADVDWAARQAAAGTSVVSLVDSVAGVRWLDTAFATAAGRAGRTPARHPVLVEVGYAGGRCGTRTEKDVDAVASAVQATRSLTLRGVSGYEGMLAGAVDGADIERVDAYLGRVTATATRLAEQWGVAGPETIVSAGGSALFDRVVDVCRPAVARTGGLLVLRSGCYAVHDHGLYARTFPSTRARDCPDLRAAATVWARVQSRPDRQRAVAAVGKRQLPHDAGLPVPLGVRFRDGVSAPLPDGCQVAMLSDHHLHLDVPAHSDLTVGDVLPFGISHPCGLFDRWRRITVVDDQRRLLGTVRPRF